MTRQRYTFFSYPTLIIVIISIMTSLFPLSSHVLSGYAQLIYTKNKILILENNLHNIDNPNNLHACHTRRCCICCTGCFKYKCFVVCIN